MKSEFYGTELAYRNGFNAALDKVALTNAICVALQKIPVFQCSMPCMGQGMCAICKNIADTIRQERGIE